MCNWQRESGYNCAVTITSNKNTHGRDIIIINVNKVLEQVSSNLPPDGGKMSNGQRESVYNCAVSSKNTHGGDT